jgi:SP family myo-inositol transporter-like MFS transporter 13
MTDAAAQPLIPHTRASPHDDDDDNDVEESEIDESALVSPGWFIWCLTVCAGISGLLFGYDTGVISSTLVSIGTALSNRPLSTLDKSLITSSTSFLALLASPLTGVLADALGRRGVILAADVLFVVGALIQACATTVWGMVLGRSVVGAAVGSASFVVPMYISELAPSAFRGRLVTVMTLLITGGQVVAYLVGWAFSEQRHGWRWMVGLGALPALVQFCTLFFLPETPRYLVKVGRKAQARGVLRKVYGVGEGMDGVVERVLRKVEKEIADEEEAAGDRNVPEVTKTGWRAKLARVNDNLTQLVAVGGNRRALIIACMLQGFQQLCGFVRIFSSCPVSKSPNPSH